MRWLSVTVGLTHIWHGSSIFWHIRRKKEAAQVTACAKGGRKTTLIVHSGSIRLIGDTLLPSSEPGKQQKQTRFDAPRYVGGWRVAFAIAAAEFMF